MHNIYFGRRCLTICSPSNPLLRGKDAVCFDPSDISDYLTLVRAYEAGNAPDRGFIPTCDISGAYRALCSCFREVTAAGGLVTDGESRYLLIRRFSTWDLPKGHRDEGEEIEETAIREVEEETGISGLEIQGLICITDHCYIRDGIWHLKHTWWYHMSYNHPVDLAPQREEDISKAAWVARSSLPPFLKDSYPSIMEVFKEIKA